MLKTLSKMALAATVALGVGAPAFAGGHAEYNLRVVANSNEADEDYAGLIVFKDYVEAASNGTIAVEIILGTQICANGTECLQALAEGSIDVTITTSGGASGVLPFVQVFDLPYVMSSDRVAEAALANGTEFVRTLQGMVDESSGSAIRLMTIGNTGGWRNFANTQRTIQTPADMEGLKIRTVVAELPQILVEALGGSPTGIPWPELFTSFQTGVVEGSKNGITDIMGMKFPDAGLQYITLDGHAYMGALWFMNNEVFKSMSESQQMVIIDGFYALQQATFAAPKRASIQAYADFVAGGGEIYVPSPEEKAMFAEAAAPVLDWFRDNVDGGSEALDALLSTVAAVEADIDAARMADMQ